MNATIEIREPGKAPRRLVLQPGPLEVGRECSGIVLSDSLVSRRHLILTVGSKGLTGTDLGSTNGTVLNGGQLGAETILVAGDVLRLGDTEIQVVESSDNAYSPGEAPAVVQDEPAAVDETVVSQRPQALPHPPPPVPADPPSQRPSPSRPLSDQAPAPSIQPPPAARPALDSLATRETESAVIRYRPGSVGESAVSWVAASVKRARRRLAGLGSEPWGIKPQICLVDPFPDPEDPAKIVAYGTVVDAGRNEIWMVVTAESPPESPERPLALVFGAALPAAAELTMLLEGYGLHLAGAPDADEQLKEQDLGPLANADEELAGPMSLSFVRYLLDRGNPDNFRRLLAESQPGRLDDTATAIYGSGMAALEEAWQSRLLQGSAPVRPGAFLRLALRYLRPHRRREAEMFVYMLAGLGFTMIFPFAVKHLFDVAIPSGDFSQVLGVIGLLGGAFAISLVAGLRQSYLSAYVSSAVIREIRTSMFGRLQSLTTGWFGRQQQGDVVSRMVSDVAALESGLSETVREGFFQMLSLVVAAIVLMILNPLLGGIVLVGAPLVGIVYKQMSGGARKRSLEVQEQMGTLVSVASENFGAQQVVKAFSLEGRERGRFRRACDRLFSAQLRLQLFGGLFGLSVTTIVTALRLIVLGLGAWLILEGDLTVGGLVAFLGLMGEVLSPVTVLTGIGQEIQAATGALERVNEVLEAIPEVDDTPEATPLSPLQHEIRLDKIGFSYSPERRTLDGIDAVITAGSRVAFVGPTGAGKSSVLQLLMRFADPGEGGVLFDGRDLRTATLSSLRDQLGVVFQESFLFDASIRENIALGKPNATDAEVKAAARAAELHDYIEDLPRGYDTMVGERGGRLSGGQRQRLAIARALIRDPRVLILDEATSALDPRTERLIADTLARVGEGRTTVAVTHRLNSITGYDRIFVIVAGKLVEQGTHDELVRFGGVYAGLWAEQTGGASVAEPPFDAAAALRKLPLFADLPDSQIELVVSRLQPQTLSSGQVVVEGGGRLAIVRRGRARISAEIGAGEGTELGPGDAFGLAALLGNETGAVLVAEGPVTLLVLDDQAMASLAGALPSVAAALERPKAAASPAGGRRLSRMTMLGSRLSLPPGPPIEPPGAGEVRRATGSFRAMGP
jgi:ABC-type multidrug transport system fused ATPase/permease subunit/pSer/pThr/pTyr-binding forkhead associated (FHA) protein